MERILGRYKIHIIWNNGCTDDILVTSNTMANIVLNGILVQSDFKEVSVYKGNNMENAIFYVLDGKYTSRALDGYFKIPL